MQLACLVTPWTHDGSTDRNAYALVRALDQSGIVSSAWLSLMLAGLAVVPMATIAAGAAFATRLGRLAEISLAFGASVVLSASIAAIVEVGPSTAIGPRLGIGFAIAAIALSGYSSINWRVDV